MYKVKKGCLVLGWNIANPENNILHVPFFMSPSIYRLSILSDSGLCSVCSKPSVLETYSFVRVKDNKCLSSLSITGSYSNKESRQPQT